MRACLSWLIGLEIGDRDPPPLWHIIGKGSAENLTSGSLSELPKNFHVQEEDATTFTEITMTMLAGRPTLELASC